MRYEQRALRMHQEALRELEERVAARATSGGAADAEKPLPPAFPVASGPASSGTAAIPATGKTRRGFKPTPDSEPIEVPEGDPRFIPPFARNYTRDEFIAAITDPESLRWGQHCIMPGPDESIWKTMAGWIEQEGLELDLETTVRGFEGHMQRKAVESAAGPAPALAADPVRDDGASKADRPRGRELERLRNEARKKAEQERKEKRKAKALARKRHR
ncbi:MAG: hypothetical protein U0800_25735 [Isosphaeraceae bacterium]